MKTKTIFLLSSLFMAIQFTGCKKDDQTPEDHDDHVHEQELITSVVLNFTSADSTFTESFAFKDPDGAGGNKPTEHDTIRLPKNSLFYSTIELLDESGSQVVDITEEVREEAGDHLFCYTPSGLAGATIKRTDSDGTYETGLETEWQTKSATTGNVKVVLKHQPGVKNGTCAPGETDVEVTFVVVVY